MQNQPKNNQKITQNNPKTTQRKSPQENHPKKITPRKSPKENNPKNSPQKNNPRKITPRKITQKITPKNNPKKIILKITQRKSPQRNHPKITPSRFPSVLLALGMLQELRTNQTLPVLVPSLCQKQLLKLPRGFSCPAMSLHPEPGLLFPSPCKHSSTPRQGSVLV